MPEAKWSDDQFATVSEYDVPGRECQRVQGKCLALLEDVGDAYALMASGKCGKVAVCFDEELTAR